jgi:hypothetical protein
MHTWRSQDRVVRLCSSYGRKAWMLAVKLSWSKWCSTNVRACFATEPPSRPTAIGSAFLGYRFDNATRYRDAELAVA